MAISWPFMRLMNSWAGVFAERPWAFIASAAKSQKDKFLAAARRRSESVWWTKSILAGTHLFNGYRNSNQYERGLPELVDEVFVTMNECTVPSYSRVTPELLPNVTRTSRPSSVQCEGTGSGNSYQTTSRYVSLPQE